MKDFRIPLKILDLQESNNEFYYVENVVDCKHLSSGEIDDILSEIKEEILDSKDVLKIVEHKIYDQCFSLSKYINYFEDSLVHQYIDILKKSISLFIKKYLVVDGTGRLKNNVDQTIQVSFKMLLSLILLNISHLIVKINSKNDIVDTGKKKKSNTSETVTFDNIFELILMLNDIIQNNFQLLWPISIPEETVLTGICNVIYQIYENEPLLQAKSVKSTVGDILAVIINKFDSIHASLSASLFNMLYNKLYISTEVVNILYRCITTFNDHRIAGELLREIGRYSLSGSNDSTGIKNISNFIIECSDKIPSDLYTNLSVILYHLNNENYTIRNAIVSAIGNLILYLKNEKTDNNSTNVQTNSRDSLFELLQERVYDVNSFVRANTMKTFTNLLTQNAIPFSCIVNITGLTVDRLFDKTTSVRKECLKLLVLLLEVNPFGCSLDINLYQEKYEKLSNEMKEIAAKEEDEEKPDENAGDEVDPEIVAKKKEFSYLTVLIQFLTILNEMPIILDKLLQSDSESDILNSCDFIYKAHLLNITFADSYVHKILTLIFNENEKISTKIIDIISSIYIYEKDSEKYQSNENIANNLIKLSYNNNIQEEMSLEYLVQGLLKSNHLNTKVIESLYQIIINSTNLKNVTYALHILYIISTVTPTAIYSKKKTEYFDGLTEYIVNLKRINSDIFEIGKYYCKLIAIICTNNQLEDNQLKSIYTIIENLLFSNINTNTYYNEWYSFCETALSSLRDIGSEPDIIYSKYVTNFSENLIQGNVSSNYLAELYHLIGSVALNIFIYADNLVRTIKSKNAINENRKSVNKTENSTDNDLNEMIGSHNENELYDQILTSISTDTLLYENLLSSYSSLLLKIIHNPENKYGSQVLQRSAVLCLCKFMVISEKFCQENIQLLFTILLRSPDTTVKCNLIISLGDLVFRYPNILEQYTSSIYSGLKDQNERVRRNTLIVLTHLILNDMIKVKGQISDVALLLEDPTDRIQNCTSTFFNELSKRGKNPIYNLLPDIVSRLTNDETVKPETFKKIMSYLIAFIKKDNQNDSICEKFCHRINATEDHEQWTCLSYCLTLLTYNEINIKKLIELSPFYKEAIKVDEVYSNFELIFSKILKTCKPESKVTIEGYYSQISELHNGKPIDPSNLSPIKKKRQARKKPAEKTVPKRKTRPKKEVIVESDTDLSSDDDLLSDSD